MRARSNEQWGIGCRNIIEVYAYGYHIRQNLERWCDMKSTILRRPWTKPFDVHTFGYRDRAILMPSQRPIRRRILIEENGANRLCTMSLDVCNAGADES